MSCPRCPCPAACLGWEAFCAWAAEDPADPVKLAHIRARSAGPAAAPAERPTAAHAYALARRTAACPYRSTGPGCGCSGARCGLRAGAIVSHRDCFACVERYGD